MNITSKRDLCSPVQIKSNRGFSLIEALVCISISGILCSILLPSILAAREAARLTECRNKLRQIGVATTAFESQHHRFPVREMMGALPDGLPIGNGLSIHCELLPYLDQVELFERLVWHDITSPWPSEMTSTIYNSIVASKSLPQLLCPTDSIAHNGTSYRACGGNCSGRQDVYGTENSGFARMSLGRRVSDISDGLSQTAFFSERLQGDRNNQQYTPFRDLIINVTPTSSPIMFRVQDVANECALSIGSVTSHASFNGSSWLAWSFGDTVYNHILPPNAATPDCSEGDSGGGLGAYSARSLHPGGVSLLNGDGSVRFINNSVELRVWRGMGTIAGGEIIEE